MTETKATTRSLPKIPQLLLSIEARNETAFLLKQISTAIHYITLIAFGYMYFTGHENARHCFVVTATSFVLAFFIPPTGMIKPDDAPIYAKKSMGWVVKPDDVAENLRRDIAAEKAKKETAKDKSKKTK